MAIEASEIYWKHPELYDAEASAARRDAGRMPALPNLKLCRSAEESMAINLLRGGAIIIAGSGMCSGGRIVHHLKHNITKRECDVIFTGFQVDFEEQADECLAAAEVVLGTLSSVPQSQATPVP